MKNSALKKVLCFAAIFVFVSSLAYETHARGGGGRGGGGGSRSGPASGGSFSSRPTQVRPAPSSQQLQQSASDRTASRQDNSAVRQDGRQENQADRQESSTVNQEGRQEQRGERQDDRSERLDDSDIKRIENREDWQDYHEDVHHDDWDNWGYVAAGAVVVGSAAYIGSSLSSSEYDELSCTANKVEVDEVTYLQCGDNWYMPTYSGSEVQYVVVDPPVKN